MPPYPVYATRRCYIHAPAIPAGSLLYAPPCQARRDLPRSKGTLVLSTEPAKLWVHAKNVQKSFLCCSWQKEQSRGSTRKKRNLGGICGIVRPKLPLWTALVSFPWNTRQSSCCSYLTWICLTTCKLEGNRFAWKMHFVLYLSACQCFHSRGCLITKTLSKFIHVKYDGLTWSYLAHNFLETKNFLIGIPPRKQIDTYRPQADQFIENDAQLGLKERIDYQVGRILKVKNSIMQFFVLIFSRQRACGWSEGPRETQETRQQVPAVSRINHDTNATQTRCLLVFKPFPTHAIL